MAFFKKKNVISSAKNRIRIGVCSAARGSGATTFSLALASFFCSKYRKKTSYVEVNGSHQIAGINSRTKREETFIYKGIFVYPDITFRQLPLINAQNFDCQVLDFGPLHNNNYGEFFRCDLGFIVGSVRPWKQDSYGMLLQRYFKQKTTLPKNICCLATLGIKEDEIRFTKRFHFPVTTFPYMEDPLQLSSPDWQFIQTLLKNTGN